MAKSRLETAARNAARGVVTLGPAYTLALLGRPGLLGSRRVRAPWGDFHFRRGESDLQVYRQIFVHREYDLKKFPQFAVISKAYEEIVATGGRPVIIDAGANVGLSAIWFARLFPAALVLAVEPDPDNLAMCRLNTEPFANIEVVAAAIGSTPGAVDLNQDGKSWSVQTERSETGEIPIVTVDGLIEQAGPGAVSFIVKIDIEGFESDLFADNIHWIDAPRAIMIEPHDWKLAGAGTSQSFQRALMGKREMLISGENLIFV